MWKLLRILPIFASLTAAFPALAYDWTAYVHVTVVEGSYIPNQVPFQIDQTVGSCPTGQFIFFNANGSTDTQKAASSTAMMALLLSAQLTGTRVVVYGYNSGCAVSNVWKLSN